VVDELKVPAPGCGAVTKEWIARQKHPPYELENGTLFYSSPLTCGQLDKWLNHESWHFLCRNCAIKAGWIW